MERLVTYSGPCWRVSRLLVDGSRIYCGLEMGRCCAKSAEPGTVVNSTWCLRHKTIGNAMETPALNHIDPAITHQEPVVEETTDALDDTQQALKLLGQPYKRADSTWSDGGTDTHLPNGSFRKGWNTDKSGSNKRWLLQMALLKSVDVIDVLEIMTKMMSKAKGGDRHCAELVLKYVVGDPVTMELMQRMQVLEQAAGVKAGPSQSSGDEDTKAVEITKTLKLRAASV